MKVKVAQWGNSLGVRLPKSAAETAGVRAGAELDLTVDGNGFRLSAISKTSAQLLDEMLDQIDPKNVPAMMKWGPDIGSEIIDDEYSRRMIVPGSDGAPVRVNGNPPDRPSRKRDGRSRRR